MSYSCRKSDLKYSRYSKTLKMLNLYSHFPAHEDQPHFEPGHGGACPQFHKSCRLSLWCDASSVNSCPSPLRPPSSHRQIERAHTCHRSFSHGQWSVKKEVESILQMVSRPSMVQPRWLHPFTELEGSCLGLAFSYPFGGRKMSQSQITKLIQGSLNLLRKLSIPQWDHHPEHDTPTGTWTHVLFPGEHTTHPSLRIWWAPLSLSGALELVSYLVDALSHARKRWSVSLVLSVCPWHHSKSSTHVCYMKEYRRFLQSKKNQHICMSLPRPLKQTTPNMEA